MKISLFVASVVFVIGVAIAIAMPWASPNVYTRLLAWGVMLIATAVLTYAVLSSAGESGAAVLANTSNHLSLPNVITLCWFVVLVSAYLAVALFNMHFWIPGDPCDPCDACDPCNPCKIPLSLDIDIPNGVWVLAGITVTHLAGTSVIRYQKKLAEAQNPLRALKDASPAKFSDLVTYDEASAGDAMDLTSVQHLMFQIAAVVVYAIALGVLMAKTDIAKAITVFPDIPAGFLALLGVSAAGNLVNRAVPR